MPDDLLNKAANGFRIVGRISDLINVARKKVNPAEVCVSVLGCIEKTTTRASVLSRVHGNQRAFLEAGEPGNVLVR
jgi:acyl-CoA synthetase (AMP-forming)/AMP-acid ligase II